MICQVCGKVKATIRITRVVDGAVEVFHVCEECAHKVTSYFPKGGTNPIQAHIEGLISMGLIDLTKAAADAPESGLVQATVRIPVCGHCGLDLLRYKKSFMLGCPHCYDAFGEHLLKDIQRIHGTTQHVVQRREAVVRPVQTVSILTQLRRLKADLELAIEEEQYDRAAALRDEIQNLEAKADPNRTPEES